MVLPETSVIQEQLWVDKYAPNSFTELLSDEHTNREVCHCFHGPLSHCRNVFHHLTIELFHLRSSYGWNSGILVFLVLKLGLHLMKFCLHWDDILLFHNIKDYQILILTGRIGESDGTRKYLDIPMILMIIEVIWKTSRIYGTRNHGVLAHQNKRWMSPPPSDHFIYFSHGMSPIITIHPTTSNIKKISYTLITTRCFS